MSLPRTLEPEVMDSLAEAREYNAMDHREVNRRFVDDLLAAALGRFEQADLDAPPVDILDLGTGTAQIPVILGRQLTGVRILAVDASAHMLDLARLNVEVASLRHCIQLGQADAKDLPYPDCQFDVVMSNSIVHHLPEPSLALAEAVRVARPGALLFFRDLLRPENEADLRALVEQSAAEASPHARAMFEASLHAALTLEEIRQRVAILGFGAETVQATSDRHWTWSVVKNG